MELSDKSFKGDEKRDGVALRSRERRKRKKPQGFVKQSNSSADRTVLKQQKQPYPNIQTGQQAQGQEHGNRNLYLRSLELSKAYKLTQDLIKSLVTVERGVRIKVILVTLETKS